MTQNKSKSAKRRSFFKTLFATISGALALKASKLLAQTQPSTEGVQPTPAALSNGTIGQICLFAGNFAPAGWAFCQGQLLPISQYSALFSILGTTYGGDGRTTFALPDLRGRAPIGVGQGPGLSNRQLGRKSGSENNTLNLNQIPSHSHTITNTVSAKCSDQMGTSSSPQDGIPARNAGDIPHYATSGNQTMALDAVTVNSSAASAGGGQSVNNMQPWLAINYIICMSGEYPSQS
jgi:microcystin-dependent protein